MTTRERFLGCLLGLAAGDAVGTTVEFKPRGSFRPLTDMVGGGPFTLLPGEWTDDTSMALCLAASLVECSGFAPYDQMMRYCRWMRDGYMSGNGRCFDIGNTVRAALRSFEATGEPYSGSTSPRSAGNGSIMRLAPIPMFFFLDHAAAAHFSGESSRTTHGAEECVDACRLFGSMIFKALSGQNKAEILFGDPFPFAPDTPPLSPNIQAIADGTYRDKTVEAITGSGYVVESLEAALWCFYQTDNFRDAILSAANLGDDADTTAAICGQIAGAFYGESGIPEPWRQRLAQAELIRDLAERLFAASAQA